MRRLVAVALAAAPAFALACSSSETASPGADVSTGMEVTPSADISTSDVTGGDDAVLEDDTSGGADVALDQDTHITDIAYTDVGEPPDTTTPPPAVPDCDPIAPAFCGLPWPSNLYLVPDPATKTGYHLEFGQNTIPKNMYGDPATPDAYRHLDGYGVSTSLLMQWPNVDLTGLPSELDAMGSTAEAANIVLFEMAGLTGAAASEVVRRVPYFVELDLTEPDQSKVMMMVRPLVVLEEATRYVVAVRGLKDTAGTVYTPSEGFALLRDGATAGTDLAPRQARFDDIFSVLAAQGIAKAGVQLAWDFVTASSESVHGRLLHLRDDAQKVVGALGPELTITKVTTNTEAEDPNIAIELEGTFHVPSYLRVEEGTDLHYLALDAEGLPVQTGWRDPVVYIKIPRTALDGTPHGLVEYGHGLNGHADEVGSGYLGQIAAQQKVILFACHMYGMSQFEINETLLTVANLARFTALPEKLHQGFMEHVVLQRAMRERFADLPDVKSAGVVVDKSRLTYYGNSQGAIYGAAVLALSTDITRGAVGVSGNNYSLLLQRSKDFEQFFSILQGYYPDSRAQILLLSIIQTLWDSVDSVTHYGHMGSKPFPGTPSHAVLADIAIGDHQVAPLTQEIVARSGVDLRLMANWGRTVEGVEPQPYPYVGSGVVSWNCGNLWAAPGNIPPTEGKDPHECPRRRPEHWQQMGHFFETGEIIDVCGGKPCEFPPN
jgi:hypothetical protein